MKKKKEQPVVAIKAERTFSTEFKRAKVAEITAKIVSVSQVSREYKVTRSAIYKWIGIHAPRPQAVQTVVQLESEQQKTQLLRARLEQLEGALGRKQLELDFLTSLIAVSSDELGIDLKKTFGTRLSSSSEESPVIGSGQ
jgi:transposase-like protein